MLLNTQARNEAGKKKNPGKNPKKKLKQVDLGQRVTAGNSR